MIRGELCSELGDCHVASVPRNDQYELWEALVNRTVRLTDHSRSEYVDYLFILILITKKSRLTIGLVWICK